MASKRDQMRELAASLLRERAGPMHYTELAGVIYAQLALAQSEPLKALNTALHDDPGARFLRVGKGTWELVQRSPAPPPRGR